MASSDDSDKHDGDKPTGGGMPAHLQLPNMDFSLPPLEGGQGQDSGQQFTGEVTTHMDLPQFPNMEAPADGGPPPLSASAGPPPPPRRGRKGDGPPPPPRRGGGQPKEDLSLPDFGQPSKKKKLTLISASIPSDVLNDTGKKSILPVVAGILVVVAVGAAVFAREPLMALINPKPMEAPKPPPPTPDQLAKKAYADGVNSYVAKDFPKAIENFDKALTLDPKLAKAHRDLGVVYATLHEQAKAVDHYRQYLELTPKAEDAIEVQKIVDDYAKAQAQPAAAAAPVAPAAEPEKKAAPDKGGKKAKGKKKGKH